MANAGAQQAKALAACVHNRAGHNGRQHIFVDTKLSAELNLEKLLDKRKYKITTVNPTADSKKLRQEIELSAQNQSDKLHLIAHGEPGFLQLGQGLSLHHLEAIATSVDNQNLGCNKTIVIWGCDVGRQTANPKQHKKTSLVTSKTPLGQQQTIPDQQELGEIIYNSPITLSNKGWKSVRNLFKANSNPKRDPDNKELWSIGPEQGLQLWGQLKGIGIELPNRTLLPVSVTSPNRNFSTWTLKFNPAKDNLPTRLPESLINTGVNNFDLTLNGKNRKITAWETTVKPPQVALPLLNWKKGIDINYDGKSKTYGVIGRYLIKGIARGKAEIEGIKIKRKNINERLDGWSIRNFLKSIEDLGLSKARNVGINYEEDNSLISSQ